MSQPLATSLRYARRVEFADTDMGGILHFAAFFRYMEEAEHALIRSLGMSVVQPHDGGHVSWPRVSAKCDYKAPVRFEEMLDIEVKVARLGSKSMTYQFTFRRGDQIMAEGEMVAVCCFIPQQEAHAIRSIPIPPAISARFAARCAASTG